MSRSKTRANVSNDLDRLIEVAKERVLSHGHTNIARSELFYREIIANLQESLKDYFVMDESFYLSMILPLAIKTTNNKADAVAAASKMIAMVSSDSSFKCDKNKMLVLMGRSFTGMQYVNLDINENIKLVNNYIDGVVSVGEIAPRDRSIAKKILKKTSMIRSASFDMWSDTCDTMTPVKSIEAAISRIEMMLLCLSVCKNNGNLFGLYGKKDNSTFLNTLKKTVSELSKLRTNKISVDQETAITTFVSNVSKINSRIKEIAEAMYIISNIPTIRVSDKEGKPKHDAPPTPHPEDNFEDVPFEDVPPDWYPEDNFEDVPFEDVPPDWYPEDNFEDVPPSSHPEDVPFEDVPPSSHPEDVPTEDVPPSSHPEDVPTEDATNKDSSTRVPKDTVEKNKKIKRPPRGSRKSAVSL